METTKFKNPQVNMYVKDVETSVRFYRDYFGFVETFRTPKEGKPIHAEVQLGGFTLGLAAIESIAPIHGFDVHSGPPRGELVLWTDDVDKTFGKLTVAGVRSLSKPHNFAEILRAAWLADPDGNPIQIVMHGN